MAAGPQAGADDGFFFTNGYEEAEDYARHAGSKVVANVSTFEKEIERLERATSLTVRMAVTSRPVCCVLVEANLAAIE